MGTPLVPTDLAAPPGDGRRIRRYRPVKIIPAALRASVPGTD